MPLRADSSGAAAASEGFAEGLAGTPAQPQPGSATAAGSTAAAAQPAAKQQVPLVLPVMLQHMLAAQLLTGRLQLMCRSKLG